MGTLLQIAGAAVVLLVLVDVFFTVLYPASGHGPLRRPMSRWVWHTFRMASRLAPKRHQRGVLGYTGPVLITLTIALWPALLICGWAMVYLPALGPEISATSGTTSHGWATAFYYSGFSLTTLGTGDIAPQTGLYRWLTVVEAAVGFAVFSMIITYFLSVYGAITQRKTFAAALDHRTFGTGDSIRLISGLVDENDVTGVLDQLSSIGEFLQSLFETHRSYPVLRYFHFRDVRYALPRILFLTLDATALVACAPQRDHDRILRSPAVALVDRAARQLLRELIPEAFETSAPAEAETHWRNRFATARRAFQSLGIDVRPDPEAVADYLRWREQWDGPLKSLTEVMRYDWAQIHQAQPHHGGTEGEQAKVP